MDERPDPPPTAATWLGRSLYARRGVLTSLAILVGLGFLADSAWRSYGPSVAQSDRYLVTRDSLSITPPPHWVVDDPSDRLLTPDAESISVLDRVDAIDRRLAETIGSHPWVRGIDNVVTTPPNRLAIDVEYRRPIAAVLLAKRLAATDVEGVRLESPVITQSVLKAFPRISVAAGDVSRPEAAAVRADAWPQVRVAGAAKILQGFGDRFAELDLFEVQIDPVPDVRAGMRFDVYRLRSVGNTVVVWGAAPGYGPPDEPSFDTKLRRLDEAVKRYGRLDSVATSPAVIDVRNGVDAFRRVVLRDKKRLAAKGGEAETVK